MKRFILIVSIVAKHLNVNNSINCDVSSTLFKLVYNMYPGQDKILVLGKKLKFYKYFTQNGHV